ncbi:MAG: pyridoxal-dependent decarboxylase [Gemmatimonadales bacterium]|nr:pyridoxal-dependent decarboxylase [Gemmatimonadales bacterium]MDZ4390885.1 pyridoxal-dependent decarboxylase [Gemmatimonadales bacterium]
MSTPAVSPSADLPPEEFRAAGYAVIDRLVDHFASLTSATGQPTVFPTTTPVELAPLFDAPVPEHGESLDTILADWEAKILPNSSIQGHPRFFAWVNGGGSQVGTLADALASGLNPNLGGWRAAQSGVVIENLTIRWLAELLGLARETAGLFVSGGTMANTAALRMALSRTATWDLPGEGLQSPERPRQLTIYMADHEWHVSFTKAVDLLGLGRNTIRLVPSRADFTIDPVALDAMLDADIAAGMTPFAIVGHAGSINVGAIDDLDALAGVAERRGLWLHVDGACGALGAMLPELRHRYRGMERADSVSFDAHKWMGVPYECGVLLSRDPAMMRRAFGVTASYLHEQPDAELERYDFFDRGPQMSRGFRALKVWMSLRHHGAEGYRGFFRQTIDCARHLHAMVEAAPDFEVVQPEPALYIYAFRYNPGGLDDAALDALNTRIAEAIRMRGVALVMTTRVRGRVCQRFSIANHRTTRADVTAVLEAMREMAT